MSNILRIFADDVKRACSNTIAVLVLVALCLAPALVAWFSIVGSWDPYANTSKLKVAVANGDEGYSGEFVPGGVNFGNNVVLGLHGNDDYGWVFVGEDEAVDGVKSGEYYAAIVIPPDFSSKLMTALSTDAENAAVTYYANPKDDPVAAAASAEGEAAVADGVRAAFEQAIDDASVATVADVAAVADGDEVNGAVSLLGTRLDNVAQSLSATAEQIRSYGSLVKTASSITVQTAGMLGGDTAADGSSGDDADDGAAADAETRSAVADLVERLGQAMTNLDDANADFRKYLSNSEVASEDDGLQAEMKTLADDVDSLRTSSERVSTGTQELSRTLGEAVTSLAGSTGSLSKQLTSVRKALNKAAKTLDKSADELSSLSDGVQDAVAAGDFSRIASLIGDNPKTVSQFLTAPVKVDRQVVLSAGSSCSHAAAVHTIFALWVGAVLLAAVMRTRVSDERVRALRNPKNYQLYLGRFLIFAVLALLQAAVAWAGDVFLLRVPCAHPLLFLAACLACSFVFANIAYTLAVSFGEMGKALCVVLLAVQVVGANGAFPTQMLGDIFQAVQVVSPFTYGLGAMQESIVGLFAGEYTTDLLKLAVFLVPSLVLGLALRRPVISLNEYVDDRLQDTGLM